MSTTHMFGIPGFEKSHFACACVYRNHADSYIANMPHERNINVVLVKMPKTKNKHGKLQQSDVVISMNFRLSNEDSIEMDISSFFESFPKKYTSTDCQITSKIRDMESRYIDPKFGGTMSISETGILINAVHVLTGSRFNTSNHISEKLFDSFMRETLLFMHDKLQGVYITTNSNTTPFILITSVVFPDIYVANELKRMMEKKKDLYTKVSGQVKSALMEIHYSNNVSNIFPCKISWNVRGTYIPVEKKI